MELCLKNIPFNLNHTLNCGQAFRWNLINEWWYGVVDKNIIKIRQDGNRLTFFTFPKENNLALIKKYFRFDDNLSKILRDINKDYHISKAIHKFYGMRIIRQESWECLISYICATNTNIPAIKNMIHNLSKSFGEEILRGFYAFPEPDVLSRVSINNLKRCGIGYRAKYILEVAKSFKEFEKNSYENLREELLKKPGVGPKVADCVCLFSLDKLEAFPVDIWITKSVLNNYSKYFDRSFINQIAKKRYKSLTKREYNEINSFGRRYFGRYAGYAQEYLFYYERITKT
ncbi:MAG: DNA glycosylase [Candidatus Aenigmatarchaeota archaeon]